MTTVAPAKTGVVIERPRATPPTPSARDDRRISELDALRGLGAMAVMLFHYSYREFVSDHGGWPPLKIQRMAVPLFFMISGYVILMSVKRVKSPMDFAVSRLSRLYPTFWVGCVLTYTAVSIWMPEKRVDAWEAWANLLMVQIQGMRPIDGVYWTLHQEMFFYMFVFGLLALGSWGGVTVRGRRPIEYAQTAMSLVVLTSLCGLRITQWMSLVLIGMVLSDSKGAWKPRHWVFLGLAAADIAGRSQWTDRPDIAGWGYVAGVAGTAGVLFVATRVRMPWLSNRVLVYLGLISYPLYLLHERIGYIILDRIWGAGINPNVAVGLTALALIGIASVVHFAVEAPAERAIRGWWKRRKARRAGAEILERGAFESGG